MSPTFWRNTIWFIILGIITVVELTYILVIVKKRKPIIAFYLTISGLAFSFETIIFMFFKSYNYFPMIITTSSFDDGLAGNLFSQFSVTATALLIAVLNLKYYWFFIFAGIYAAIEEVFQALGIFKHNWYQTWMTVIAFILFFVIVKLMYKKYFKHPGYVLRYIYIFLGLFPLHFAVIVWYFRLSGNQLFSQNILPDKDSSYILLAIIDYILLSNTIMAMYLLKLKWKWKLIIIMVYYMIYYVVYKTGLIYINEGWFFIFTTAAIFSTYFFVFLLDKLNNPAEKALR